MVLVTAPVCPSALVVTATLTLNNNDSDEGTFVIHIEVIFGTGATEPANQPTALNFTNQKSFTHIVNYTASASAEKYIVSICNI